MARCTTGKTGVLAAAFTVLSLLLPANRSHGQSGCGLTFDCFSVIVGRNASADGSVIVAHNEDTGTKLVNYYKVPAKEHQPGEAIRFETGATTTQVSHTLGYLWINLPVCDVCDTYINEAGVFVGSDGCPSQEDKPELTNGGIVFWLRRMVAEQARTAREGVSIAGKLIAEFGYASSGRTYIIADSRECWIMNVVNGKHWVAARVPDNAVAVIPNNFTIREINLKDTANYQGSPDLVDYAVSRGWYNAASDGAFLFNKAYSNPGSLTHPDNIHRQWRATEMLSGRKYDVNGILPFSFEPEKKISYQDVMRVLRDHYEGTELDKSKLYTNGNPHRMNSGTICSGGSQYSTVTLLRSWLPVEIGTLVWIAPFRPCTQAYTAWYPSITGIPSRYAQSDYESALKNHFNPAFSKGEDKRHAFRVFVSLVDAVDRDYWKFIPSVQSAWRSFEEVNFRDQERIEREAVELFKNDPKKAVKHLTANTSMKAMEVYRKAGQLKRRCNDVAVDKAVFRLQGREAFVILPEKKSNPVPWVWYAPTLPGLPGKEERWMFERFLKAGIAVAGIDAGESYGSPDGNKLYSALYEELTSKRGFSAKPVMLGRSRGGLMTLSWISENPDKTGGFAGIYPVCDLTSYPGLDKACGAFNLTQEQLKTRLSEFNPIDKLSPLAKARIPLFAIHGDVDDLVPLDRNSGEMKKRYDGLGGKMELIVPAGQGHNMWEGFFQCEELVRFVIRHAR